LKILVTGARGFIGRNLCQQLREQPQFEIVEWHSSHDPSELAGLLAGVSTVFHFAGVNRPDDPIEFMRGNRDLTQTLAEAVVAEALSSGRAMRLVFASSTQAGRDNDYGSSKRAAEQAVFAAARTPGVSALVLRLPNVFGKWSRPDYNSAIATFCHNVARDLPIQINDPAAPLELVYIDDLVAQCLHIAAGGVVALDDAGFVMIASRYLSTVGAVAEQIRSFRDSRHSLTTGRVGTGLERALYATYVSFLPTLDFQYDLPMHTDARGTFVEFMKTPDCGQFSYFTAHPGVTRGGHYHHTKTEKFLVLKGLARFRFRDVQTGAFHSIETSGERARIVETIPGWTYDITNIGTEEMVVMLWANEVFDRTRPDTITCPIQEPA